MKSKYENIRFCHPSSNKICKKLLDKYISNRRKSHPLRYVASTNSNIQKYSKSVEKTVRRLFGSQNDRFLLYDVIYEGIYHSRMREVDIVNIKSSDTIQVGEIKLTSNKTRARYTGSKQLQITTEILQKRYSKVECVLIIIDLINDYMGDETCDSIFNNSKIIKNEFGFQYELIEITVPSLMLKIYKLQ
jgi:hypothetical protein